jgi:hypothetical protein
MTKLKIEFGFGLGYDKDNKSISPTMRGIGMIQVAAKAAALFQGFTIYQTLGGWMNPAGHLVSEKGATLLVYVDGDVPERTKEMAEYIKHQFNQHSVYVTTQQVNLQEL